MKNFFLFIVFNIIFIKFAFAKIVTPDDWSGFYLGFYKSEDKLSASATSDTWTDDPYDVSTDKNIYNSGIFLGYNYSIKDIIVGVETNFQDDVGEDAAITNLNGFVLYDDLFEYKLKLGYAFGRNMAAVFYGSGDLNVYWSDYANEDTSTHDYEVKGIELSRKITKIHLWDSVFLKLI
ncbi:MAG: hypothetical protein CFH14_00833 [Alphaproteobacteria bacterium MarineAlpha5_Bin4]|nr:MAG: hypothetical protein CFH14_00833 [Alphaproteobacteria bacterium MarineAlpha5_Bin4]